MTFRAPVITKVGRRTVAQPEAQPNLLGTTLAPTAAASPFTQVDWPNPTRHRQAGGISLAANLLLTVLAVAPFVSLDWPNPQRRETSQAEVWQNQFPLKGVSISKADGADPWRQRTYRTEEDEIEKRIAQYREHREKLRADILLAINGPAPEPVIEALVEHAEPETDVQTGESLDFGSVLSDMQTLRKLAEFAISEQRRRDDEDEEDVELLLLH